MSENHSTKINIRIDPAKKEFLQSLADEYSLSLSELIRSELPSTYEGAELPEHVIKNSALQEVKEKMQWRHTAMHLKDNIARGYAHELMQVEPAEPDLVFDYLYPKYLGEAYESFMRTEPRKTERYKKTIKHLNKWQNDYALCIDKETGHDTQRIDAIVRVAKTIHRAEGREAGLAFVSRQFERHKLLPGDKQDIIKKARLESLEEETDLSIDRGHNASGGFS